MSGSKKGLSAVAVAGIVLGVTIFAVFVTSVVLVLKGRRHRTPIALRSQMSQLVRSKFLKPFVIYSVLLLEQYGAA